MAHLYYDPYDTEIDDDPYPRWKRLRDEAPLYYNEQFEFYALSRWDDVEAALLEDPDRFDIHRKSEGHMSFGYGLHFCLGAALARLEGRVALDEILKRWPEWDVDYERASKAHTTSVRGWGSLPIRTKRTR